MIFSAILKAENDGPDLLVWVLLTQAGADTVTTGLDEITRALRLTPVAKVVDGSLRPGLTQVSAAVACP